MESNRIESNRIELNERWCKWFDEKNEPNILKAERIRRIARGSGVKEKNVRELLAQWNRSRKMMKGIKGNRKLRRQMKGMMSDMDDMDMPM